jgi:hypothetical protein
MHTRIDAVSGSPPVHLRPVDPVNQSGRRPAHDDPHAPLEADVAATFGHRDDAAAAAYTPPAGHGLTPPDNVAPALFDALAPEPWGHPMPQKAVWEQAQAARKAAVERAQPADAPAAVTVAAVAASPADPVGDPAPATPVATTAAAPATQAAVQAAGSSAPVSPAWLASLLKAR